MTAQERSHEFILSPEKIYFNFKCRSETNETSYDFCIKRKVTIVLCSIPLHLHRLEILILLSVVISNNTSAKYI